MYTKYPRTFHLPWSRTKTDDDKVLRSIDHFKGKEVIVTEKLDGENTSLYTNYQHARSIDSKDHPSRHWLKQFHAAFAYEIPEDWRVCGEYVYAKHSIFYEELTHYFYLFSIWNEKNHCLSWDETMEWAKLLRLETVPVLYRGIWDEAVIKKCFTGSSKFGGAQEGYVVRLAEEFSYENFSTSVAKFVRKNHVQTDQHWMQNAVEPNQLTKKHVDNTMRTP
ncbi:RNA ligase family protein [Lysinibacillus odysseyi]|uniref:2'-5' RNA ligase n=1 Tax=Lysinibacillus odysseyi 34hs-1 = NBRC 100172 TaxID=1220589 RepID=A0A0A3III9_9BACI|nr:RNA ligase family protein [Lysinibacillus odysseyi]KGR84586.1 2'-5' RNA ligase [Lysinibacillus odysseyi 34hs-1 = NBRC 100172]